MQVTRKSMISGQVNTMDLDVTQSQLDSYERGEGYIQTIFPNLDAGEREFVKSGITPDEWAEMFGSGEEE